MPNDSLPLIVIAIFIAVIGLLGIVFRQTKPHRSGITYLPQSGQYSSDDDGLDEFPYQLQHNFLTPSELNYFQNLRRVVGNRAAICSKVGLKDVFWVKLEDKTKFRAYRNKIDRKHIDFLLCDPATMKPLVGIELDDSSHQREDRQERDAFVDGVFAAAGLPLLHVPAKRAYVVEEIVAQLAPYLRAVPVSPANATPVKAPQSVEAVKPAAVAEPVSESPLCPKCGSEMILRTAKSGSNAGSKFWGCSNYPNCRGMLPRPSSGSIVHARD